MLAIFSHSFEAETAIFNYRPNDRRRSAVVVGPRLAPAPVKTHLPASTMNQRSQDDLNTWLRYAVSGTSLVLHLDGSEQLGCARRLAWFVETCRRFNIDLDLEADCATRSALELLHALGAEIVRFDDTLSRDWRGRAVVRRVRSFAESLNMAA